MNYASTGAGFLNHQQYDWTPKNIPTKKHPTHIFSSRGIRQDVWAMFKTLKFNRISEPSTIPPPPAATVQHLGGTQLFLHLDSQLLLLLAMTLDQGVRWLGMALVKGLKGHWVMEENGMLKGWGGNSFLTSVSSLAAFFGILAFVVFFLGGGGQKQVGRWVRNFSICAFVVGETLWFL